MDYIILPVTAAPYQVLYLPVSPEGNAFLAKVELRWLGAPGRWFLSVSDAVTGELYVNQIPLICSCSILNDLFGPFRWRFQGSGLGSFFCLKQGETPAQADPGRENLTEYTLLWGDRFISASGG